MVGQTDRSVLKEALHAGILQKALPRDKNLGNDLRRPGVFGLGFQRIKETTSWRKQNVIPSLLSTTKVARIHMFVLFCKNKCHADSLLSPRRIAQGEAGEAMIHQFEHV